MVTLVRVHGDIGEGLRVHGDIGEGSWCNSSHEATH